MPVWVDKELETHFSKWIVTPFRNPVIFHKTLAPIPWAQIVLGRHGVNKSETIEHLAEKYEIHSRMTINVQFGRGKEAIQEFMCALKAAQDQTTPVSSQQPQLLIILNHADILCYEAESEDVALVACELGKMAAKEKIMLLALCDRPRGAEEMQHMTPWAQKCVSKFFAQFAVVGYDPCPDAEFLLEYTLAKVKQFAQHMAVYGRLINVNVASTDEEKILLKDCISFTTQEHIDEWMQSVCYNFVLDPFKTDLDMTVLQETMVTASGRLHICAFDAMEVETRFREACGRGAKALIPQKKHKPKEEEVTTVRLLTEEGASAEGALKELGDVLDEREAEAETENEFKRKKRTRRPTEKQKESDEKKIKT